MKSKIAIYFVPVIVLACTTTSSYIPVKSALAKPTDCPVEIYMPGQRVEELFEVIGSFSVQEMGLSVGCDWEDTLAKNKQYACENGADAIQFLSIDTPSIHSTCYTSKANFIIYKK